MVKSEFAQNVELPFHVEGVRKLVHTWGLLSEDICIIWRCELMQDRARHARLSLCPSVSQFIKVAMHPHLVRAPNTSLSPLPPALTSLMGITRRSSRSSFHVAARCQTRSQVTRSARTFQSVQSTASHSDTCVLFFPLVELRRECRRDQRVPRGAAAPQLVSEESRFGRIVFVCGFCLSWISDRCNLGGDDDHCLTCIPRSRFK